LQVLIKGGKVIGLVYCDGDVISTDAAAVVDTKRPFWSTEIARVCPAVTPKVLVVSKHIVSGTADVIIHFIA